MYYTMNIYSIQAEVRYCTYFATESIADQDVPCCQVPVDKPSLCQVPHTISNLLAEP